MKKLTIKESTEPIKESSNGPRYVTRDIINKTNSQKLKDAYDKGELEVLINGDVWYTERCPKGLGKELKAEMKRLYPNIKHLYGESVDKSSTLSKLVKSGYSRKEIQKFFKDETGLDMTPENSEEFKRWSAKFLNSIDKSKSIKEDYSDEVVTLSRYLDVEVPDVCREVLDLIEHLPSHKIVYITKICRDFYTKMESIISNYTITSNNLNESSETLDDEITTLKRGIQSANSIEEIEDLARGLNYDYLKDNVLTALEDAQDNIDDFEEIKSDVLDTVDSYMENEGFDDREEYFSLLAENPTLLIQWAVGILFDMNKFVTDVEDNEYWLTYGVGDGEFEETTTDKAKNNYKEHEWLVTDVDTHEFDVEAFNDFLNAFKSATSNKSDYNQEERQRIIDAAEGLLSAVDEEYSLDESIKESYSKSYTRKMLEYSDLLDEQGLRDLVLTFVKWMGDDEIGDLARANDLVSVFEESKQSTGDKLSINEEIALFNDDSADFTVDQQIDLYLMELQSMLETINSMFNEGKLYERPLLDALKKCYDIIDNTPEK